MRIKPLRVIALAVMPAVVTMAGINFGATENGSSRPSWGRTTGSSWGMTGFLVKSGNALATPHFTDNVADGSLSFDAMNGFGANNPTHLGYQVSGPGGTRLIFDRLAFQTVAHVLGGDIDDQIGDAPNLFDRFSELRPTIAGFAFADGASQPTTTSFTGIIPPPTPTPNPTPEPTSAALMGMAAWLIGLRRPSRQRQA